MPPDITINAGGDATIGGDLSGRDKQTVVGAPPLTEREYESLLASVGKIQSDMVTVRLKIAALEERFVFGLIAIFGVLVLAGVSLIIALIR